MIHLRLLNRFLAVAFALVSLLSCENKDTEHTPKIMEADALISAAHKNHEYQQLLKLADQLEAAGQITDIQADYWRGYSYSRQHMMRLSEKYWKEAINTEITNHEGLVYYAKSANRLTGVLMVKGEYETTMKVAVTAIEKLNKADYRYNSDYAYLQAVIGCCQLKFGNLNEAKSSFRKAYNQFHAIVEIEPTRPNYTTAIAAVITITDNYLQENLYQEALDWTMKLRELLDYYESKPHAEADFLDKQRARQNLYYASSLEGLGNSVEARRAYNEALKSKYIQTNDGKVEAINYLISAKRWTEAADNFEVLDKQFQQYGITEPSVDIIQQYLLPKYRANIGAHRDEVANEVSRKICNLLDSAINLAQRDAAMELAAIYNTQQKEKEIAAQHTDMVRQRYMATVVTLLLVIICFVLIIYFRHQSSIRLEKAYSKLEIANERIKESSRMKTSFIRQMSHEIRTPLNILSGFTQIITSPGIELNDETKRDLNKKIIENTDRITELVNKMLEMSDVSSQTVLDRNDKIKAVQIALKAVADISANPKCHIPVDLQMEKGIEELELLTNENAATRALLLLLDNAEQFTKEGTVILKVNRINNMVQYVVEDTGVGIPADEAEHIFEEFVQLDEYEEGTGIGLTVARSICRRLGGDLVLDTSYTHGARFVMTLAGLIV